MILLLLLFIYNVYATPYNVISSFDSTDYYTGSIQTCTPCSIVWVHGYGADYNAAIQCFDQISSSYLKAGGTCNIYGFAWDSESQAITPQDFKEKMKLADKIGAGSFTLFIKDLTMKCPGSKISLLAHSLGDRIIFYPPNEGIRGISNIIAISAAIDYDVLEKSHEFEYAISNVNNTYIAYNSDDIYVLDIAYSLASSKKALGLNGMHDPDNVVGNFKQIDFSEDWGTEHPAVYDSEVNTNFWKYFAPITETDFDIFKKYMGEVFSKK